MRSDSDQQHPIGLYLKIWALLFVLSAMSYMVDFYQVQGYLRWALIVILMLLKAGLIMAIFMHLKWERLSLKLVLFIPPIAIALLVLLMAIEGEYTFLNRLGFLSSE
ncbi:cytochrome C oxidase subunit IV family protein [Biformimicrobium ophioploci]|uniref:Cytochrome C oxidase subunit IV family protein n=1 Tax=Biformimicrobium ophioploci TaxID=3036711 RepID=A0ABQ6LXZ2_9GAMM|nr:cytochrome C oxidase subunit IV family protein [Microbulbifer sp. NKW57]GMG86933.1 cytochrome C oxidase subunit IV family protein [Microbulbifer sp. NKW57]